MLYIYIYTCIYNYICSWFWIYVAPEFLFETTMWTNRIISRTMLQTQCKTNLFIMNSEPYVYCTVYPHVCSFNPVIFSNRFFFETKREKPSYQLPGHRVAEMRLRPKSLRDDPDDPRVLRRVDQHRYIFHIWLVVWNMLIIFSEGLKPPRFPTACWLGFRGWNHQPDMGIQPWQGVSCQSDLEDLGVPPSRSF